MLCRLTFLFLPLAFGAGPEAIERNATALVQQADQAAASSKFAAAEEAYKAAIQQCDLLPPDKYHCKTDVLRKVGNFFSRTEDAGKAEAAYKERLDVLMAHEKPGERPDLDIGIALFDLLALNVYELFKGPGRESEEAAYFEGARSFYEDCKAGFIDLNAACDRRLAYVETLHGSMLFVTKNFDAAIPLLKAVVDRPDSGVRQEHLTAALRAYATILISKGQNAEAQALMERVRRLESGQK
jgi:tetratricopeptide (TPR) repeat protein